MITNHTPSDTLLIYKVCIIDFKKVIYPLHSVLQKKDIFFEDDDALIIQPLPEDVKFPSTSKLTDAGTLSNYKISITINNQLPQTVEQLERLRNRKVICIIYTNDQKIIIGCNEQPLSFLYEEDNTSKGDDYNGFTIELSGNTYYNKVVC